MPTGVAHTQQTRGGYFFTVAVFDNREFDLFDILFHGKDPKTRHLSSPSSWAGTKVPGWVLGSLPPPLLVVPSLAEGRSSCARWYG